VLLAAMEAFYSRPVAPTRRVALGFLDLPTDPAPGYGGILLAGIAAAFGPELDEDFDAEARRLLAELERGRRISQPRLRHRLQVDRVGLQPCTHRLVADDSGALCFDLEEERGTPAQHVLCAIYAAGRSVPSVRSSVLDAVRVGLGWGAGPGPALVAHLSGRSTGLSVEALRDPIAWALGVLDLRGGGRVPSRRDVQQAFRSRLRDAHPDHGARDDRAAERISELAEARRILLGST
jgi:hypothetical protein